MSKALLVAMVALVAGPALGEAQTIRFNVPVKLTNIDRAYKAYYVRCQALDAARRFKGEGSVTFPINGPVNETKSLDLKIVNPPGTGEVQNYQCELSLCRTPVGSLSCEVPGEYFTKSHSNRTEGSLVAPTSSVRNRVKR